MQFAGNVHDALFPLRVACWEWRGPGLTQARADRGSGVSVEEEVVVAPYDDVNVGDGGAHGHVRGCKGAGARPAKRPHLNYAFG